MSVIMHSFQSLYSREKTPVFTEYEAGWAPESVRTFSLLGFETPDCPVHSLVDYQLGSRASTTNTITNANTTNVTTNTNTTITAIVLLRVIIIIIIYVQVYS